MKDIFAYGSLINLHSAFKTIGRPILQSDIKTVRLNNYTRIWNYKSKIFSAELKSEATAVYLNLISTPGKFVNGIVFSVSDEEFEKLKIRERNYSIIDVSEDIGFDILPVYAFICKDPEYLSKPDDNVIVMQKYIDMVKEGCLDMSEAFFKEYQATTKSFTYQIIPGDYKFI